jgi:hypothetical protein
MHIDEDLLVRVYPQTALDPALQLARDQIVNEHRAKFAIVEARNCGEVLASIFAEYLAAFDVKFIERFEAIGGKPRCDDNQALGPLGRETLAAPFRASRTSRRRGNRQCIASPRNAEKPSFLQKPTLKYKYAA